MEVSHSLLGFDSVRWCTCKQLTDSVALASLYMSLVSTFPANCSLIVVIRSPSFEAVRWRTSQRKTLNSLPTLSRALTASRLSNGVVPSSGKFQYCKDELLRAPLMNWIDGTLNDCRHHWVQDDTSQSEFIVAHSNERRKLRRTLHAILQTWQNDTH